MSQRQRRRKTQRCTVESIDATALARWVRRARCGALGAARWVRCAGCGALGARRASATPGRRRAANIRSSISSQRAGGGCRAVAGVVCTPSRDRGFSSTRQSAAASTCSLADSRLIWAPGAWAQREWSAGRTNHIDASGDRIVCHPACAPRRMTLTLVTEDRDGVSLCSRASHGPALAAGRRATPLPSRGGPCTAAPPISTRHSHLQSVGRSAKLALSCSSCTGHSRERRA